MNFEFPSILTNRTYVQFKFQLSQKSEEKSMRTAKKIVYVFFLNSIQNG
jgi:hypothetical protein